MEDIDDGIIEIDKINVILSSSRIGKDKIKEINNLLSTLKIKIYELKKENILLKKDKNEMQSIDNTDLDKIKYEITKLYKSFCDKKSYIKNRKTLICKYYIEGTCTKGEKCLYLHNTNIKI
jgi:hypothetical protein